MPNSPKNEKPETVTLTLTVEEFVDLHMAVSHLVYTLDEQDTVLMGFPGEEGEKHLNALYEKLSAVLSSITPKTEGLTTKPATVPASTSM